MAGFWSAFGEGMAQAGGQGIMSNIGAFDRYINPLTEDAVNSAFESDFANYQQQKMFDYEMQSQYEQNSPSWRKAGLEKAGLNPMLAVNNGAGNWSAGGQVQDRTGKANYSVDWNASAVRENLKAQNENLKEQNEQIKSQTYKNQEDAKSARLQAEKGRWQIIDAKTQGYASFNILCLDAGGKYGTVMSYKLDSSTGKIYTLQGQEIKDIQPVSSASKLPDTKTIPQDTDGLTPEQRREIQRQKDEKLFNSPNVRSKFKHH